MSEEIISKVNVLASGKLLLALKSGGKDSYQYIYREAAGVYCEDELKGFVSTEPKEWSYPEWFTHIVTVANSMGVELKLSNETNWNGVSENDKQEVLSRYAIKK